MNMQYTEDASGITLVIDEQPDVQPAPSYDVSMDDWEVDGMAITSAQMAKDFLQSGRALMCVCGPLHVIAGADENPGVSASTSRRCASQQAGQMSSGSSSALS